MSTLKIKKQQQPVRHSRRKRLVIFCRNNVKHREIWHLQIFLFTIVQLTDCQLKMDAAHIITHRKTLTQRFSLTIRYLVRLGEI